MTVIDLLLNFPVASTISVITTSHPKDKAHLAVAYSLQTLQEGAVALPIQIVNLHRRNDFKSSDERTDFQFQRWHCDKVKVLRHQAVCKKTHLLMATTFDKAVDDAIPDFRTRKDGQILMGVDCDESRTPVVVVMPKSGHV